MQFWFVLALAITVTLVLLTGLHRLGKHLSRYIGPAWQLRSSLAATVALGVALASAGALLFLLTAQAWQTHPVLQIDAWAAALGRDAWSRPGRFVMTAITALGAPITLWGLAAAVGLWLWRRQQPALLVGWLVALGGNAIANPALKSIYQRLRPDPDVSRLVSDGYSFPSGHSSGAIVAYGMLTYLAWRLLPHRWGMPLLWLATGLILSIAASRVYLQAHFLSDVLAGLASGGMWLAACIAGSAAWSATRQKPENRPLRSDDNPQAKK